MQKPKESLDDFLNSIEPQATAPPSQVSLCRTGEVEILRPLALDQVSAKTANRLLLQQGGPRISWFHRSLIFGAGAAAAVALIFLSAVFVAISEPSDQASVVGVDTPRFESDAPIDDSLAPVEETATADIFASPAESQVFGEFRADRRPVVRSKRTRHRVRTATYVSRRSSPARKPAFIPTTLIIYAENGEIKTRIEPNLTAANKIPVSFSN